MRTVVVLLLALPLVACSGGDPLGGPYGGTGSSPGPNGQQSGDPSNPSDPSNPDPSNPSNNNNGTDAGSSNNGGKDSGSSNNNNPVDSGKQQQQQPQAPTWTQIWTNYLQAGTKGNCKSSCHSQMSSPSAAYSWLKGRGYISGTTSALVDSSQSCLSWYGGNMPPSGPGSVPAATTDMDAWVKAGALNN